LTVALDEEDALETSTDAVSFDLHGFVGIRLLDARPRDVNVVQRQLGLPRVTLRREPDITVRFVDTIAVDGPLTYAGWGDGGFTDDAFYVLRGKGNVRAKARIPFADVGDRCEIVCERAMPAVPLLLAVVNFTALAKGVLPLHASAFTYEGTGVLATGWAKGGKTETLLAFMSQGASYVGDEWVYLTPDGRMHGVPEPIRLWSWQLRQLPELLGRLPRGDRARLRGLHAASRSLTTAAAMTKSRGPGVSVLRRVAPVAARQAYLQVPPAVLFGSEKMALSARLDAVLLVASHEAPDVRVDPIDPAVIAHRMRASLVDERAPFMAYYRQYQYAFPGSASAVVERADDSERGLLDVVLADKPAAYLRHPYPLEIQRLLDPILDVLPTLPDLRA
jgi:hypothetical protein